MTQAVQDISLGAQDASLRYGWRRYLGAMFLGVMTAFACLGGTFVLLWETGNLPPPAISNNLCLDEKLEFMRDNPPDAPNFLVVGSSVAWRHVDSSIVANAMPGTVPYNAAFCALHVNQTLSVTRWLVQRLPTVRQILFLASPEDFETCSRVPSPFDVAEADRYVFQHAWRWGFYFRYFDPVSLIRNASSIAYARVHADTWESLSMTRYGDAPLNPPGSKGLIYDGIAQFDPTCFEALRILASELTDQGIALTMVNTPLNPLWEQKYDAHGRTRAELNRGIEAALAGSGARHVNGNAIFHEGPEAFTDAIHLRWPAAQRFTKVLVEDGLSKQSATLAH